MRDVETDEICTETVSSLITDSTTMIVAEFLRLPQGVGHMHLGNTMTGALTVVGEGFQSTPGSQALTRDPSSFKVWLTGIEHTEKAMTEITRLAAGGMFPVPSVSAEPSEQQ